VTESALKLRKVTKMDKNRSTPNSYSNINNNYATNNHNSDSNSENSNFSKPHPFLFPSHLYKRLFNNTIFQGEKLDAPSGSIPRNLLFSSRPSGDYSALKMEEDEVDERKVIDVSVCAHMCVCVCEWI
jgi:hypothetical protein